MRNKILFPLLILIITVPALSEQSEVLYLRADTKTANGIVVESNLLVVPADNDFRIKAFNCYTINGQAKNDATPDALSAAKHNAFLNLLLLKGIKSINNKSELKQSHQYDESILSYEGFLKSDYTITKKKYTADGGELLLELEVWFAPIAYPPEWSFYYFKKKLYDLMRNVISLFR